MNLKNFWNMLDAKERKRIITVIVLIGVGVVLSIAFFFFDLNVSLFGQDQNTELTTDSERDTESEDFYNNLGEENAYENQYREEVLELIAKFDEEGVKMKESAGEKVDFNSVTALNGDIVENLDDLTEAEVNKFLEENGVTKDKYKNYSLNDRKMLYLGNQAYGFLNSQYTIVDKSKVEYDSKGDNTIEMLLTAYQNQEYESVVAQVNSIKEKYSLSKGENRFIAELYADASLMKDYGKISETSQQENMLKAHKNPVALAIDTLYVSPRLRESVIVKNDSLSPYLEGLVTVKSYTRINNDTETFRYHSNEYGETVNLYEIILETDDMKEMVCYVREDAQGQLTIDGYYDNGEPTGYRTVQFWIDSGMEKE